MSIEQVAPTPDRNETEILLQMEDLWGTSPETPQPAASAASAAPLCSTPESNGASKRAVKALACVDASSKKGRRNRSPYWAYFDKFVVDGLQKAICKYCSRQVGCDPRSGTSVLKNHIERCKGYPPKLILDEGYEQKCSPLPASTLDPSYKFPAARTVYQMMETMGSLKQDPFACGSSTLPPGSSADCNGYRTGRTPWAITENDLSYKIRFDIPGLTRNDVKVWIEDNMLVVEAEKVPKRCQVGIAGHTDVVEDGEEWPAESYGKYKSRITLPETVNVENVKARVKDGVLYITIPKGRLTRRRIDIIVQ